MWFARRSRVPGVRDARRDEQLRYLALHDPLTGLANRALLMDRAEHMLARARREEMPTAAFFLDLDDFKDINDGLGHRAGDAVLVQVGRRITAALRGGDTVGRLGGDEFVALVEGDSLSSGAEPIANRILDVVHAPISLRESEDPVQVTASIGIAVGKRESAEDLLRDADIALYRAKAAGKRQFVLFAPEMELAVRRRRELELDLRRALVAEEFFLVYRPTPRLTPSAGIGLEAQLRWRHPARGVLEPPEFLSELESSGLIVPLGRWILETACRSAATWHRHAHRFTISVAISPRQLERPTFLDDVRSILVEAAIPPDLLMLEIAEAALLTDDTAMPGRLRALRALGVRLAAVDPGFTSVAYLRQLPIDTVRIDRPVPEDLAPTKEAQAFIAALVQLGVALGLDVIGEDPGLDTARSPAFAPGASPLHPYPLDADSVEAFLTRLDEEDAAKKSRRSPL